MSIFVSGSIAYDRIMTFPGKFEDHILPEKLHMINVSFQTDRIEEKRGGTAGNIAYSLALLEEKPLVYSTVGNDFANYAKAFTKLGINLDSIVELEDSFTACAYITSDMRSNQITGFSPAAMLKAYNKSFFPKLNKEQDIAVVAPGNTVDMEAFPSYYREHGLKWIFDPGQQIVVLSPEALLNGIQGAEIYIGNDYELEMLCKKTGKTKKELLTMCKYMITTFGEKGSAIETVDSNTPIGIAKVENFLDPTGGGDAYRAGLLKGLHSGLDIVTSAKMGAVCAAFCVEQYGTQEHSFTMKEFEQRLKANF